MKISASYLSIKDLSKEDIINLSESSIDFLHVDVMDGKFVQNKTMEIQEIEEILKDATKPLDVHLMVEDVIDYVEDYKNLNPEYITFHVEVDNVLEKINYIKSLGIKVGLSIKPNTDISLIYPYLKDIDLVLVMSVEPGLPGQKFLMNSLPKVIALKQIRKDNNYDFLIEIDGGINDETIELIDVDIVVIGSYITNENNYEKQIQTLKNKKNKLGFTLIEVLAVVVVIGIIIGIATPIVFQSIIKARKDSAVEAAIVYIKNVENVILSKELKGEKLNNSDIPYFNSLISSKTILPKSGELSIANTNTVIMADLCIHGYKVIYDSTEYIVGDKC